MLVDIDAIPNAIETRLGLPRPDWAVIWDWTNTRLTQAELNDAYTQLARQWLNKLQQALPVYRIDESENFLILSAGDSQTSARLIRWCEYFRNIVLDTLSRVACDEGFGKHVLLAFASRDSYYDYVADSYPDVGEFGLSSGVFLDPGYGHIAVCSTFDSVDRTIAHELIHAMLRHLPLPLWLNEGATQVVEDIAVGSSSFLMHRELAQRHRAYWNRESIHSFWSGDSFHLADEGQELSYSLAEVLFRNLMADYPRKTMDFVATANFHDAGEIALRSTCSVGLSDRVTQFLGVGQWEPRSDYGEPKAAFRTM